MGLCRTSIGNLCVQGKLQARIWAQLDIRHQYDEDQKGKRSPFWIDSLKPIQLATFDLEEYRTCRNQFTTEEWIDLLLRTIGLEPSHFSRRQKLHYLEKAQEFGIELFRGKRKRVRNETEVAFQVLPLNAMLAAPASLPCLSLERPDGMRVRIEGQLPDTEYVGRLAACLWK